VNVSSNAERPVGISSEGAVPQRPRSPVTLILLVSGLTGALLCVARGAFIPVALAVLFALLLSSPVEALHRKGLPRSVSALVILAIFLGLVGGTVNLLWEPVQQWLGEGQVVEPLFVGQRLKLSPIIVFLALWFGGWFWGVAGIVLAIPCLVALKVAAEHSEHGAPLVAFLSPSAGKRLRPRGAGLKGRPAQKAA
jgi:predicted PurR-regulated permease PerM